MADDRKIETNNWIEGSWNRQRGRFGINLDKRI